MTNAASAQSVRLEFLRDLTDAQRTSVIDCLAILEIDERQLAFVNPASSQLEQLAANPSRDTFAICVEPDASGNDPHASHLDCPNIVGMGTLHVEDDPNTRWGAGKLMFKGFLIHQGWQGKGIGSKVTELVMQAARERYPQAKELRLVVHTENPAGQRAYEKSGFVTEGEPFDGRAGIEQLMCVQLY